MQLKSVLFFVLLLLAPVLQAETVSGNPAWSCLNRYVVALARRAEVIGAVQRHNQAPPDFRLLDRHWPGWPESAPEVARVITHPLVPMMEQTISSVSYLGEGLLMGQDGGLVAATGKTTDFWQGDETQFSAALPLAQGQVHVEGDTADASTHSMLIKISTPVVDPATRQVIGVLMLGFDQFVVDFQDTCAANRQVDLMPAGAK